MKYFLDVMGIFLYLQNQSFYFAEAYFINYIHHICVNFKSILFTKYGVLVIRFCEKNYKLIILKKKQIKNIHYL